MSDMGFMGILQQLLGSLPIIIALFTGLVLAVLRRDRHPRASLFTTIGAAAGLLNIVAGFAFQSWLRLHMADNGGYGDMQLVFLGNSAVHGLLSAVAWGFLVAAIFSDRGPPPVVATR